MGNLVQGWVLITMTIMMMTMTMIMLMMMMMATVTSIDGGVGNLVRGRALADHQEASAALPTPEHNSVSTLLSAL